jgi:hypothetical protein
LYADSSSLASARHGTQRIPTHNEGYSFAAGRARWSLSLPGRSCDSSGMLFEIFYQRLQAWRFQFPVLLTTIVGSLLKRGALESSAFRSPSAPSESRLKSWAKSNIAFTRRRSGRSAAQDGAQAAPIQIALSLGAAREHAVHGARREAGGGKPRPV